MNDAQRKKLNALKAANRPHAQNLRWQSNALLQDCLQALGSYRIIDKAEAAAVLAIASSAYTEYSHSAVPFLDPAHAFALVWDEAQLPVIECLGADLLAHWKDVMAVAFDTCLVDLEEHRAILIRN